MATIPITGIKAKGRNGYFWASCAQVSYFSAALMEIDIWSRKTTGRPPVVIQGPAKEVCELVGAIVRASVAAIQESGDTIDMTITEALNVVLSLARENIIDPDTCNEENILKIIDYQTKACDIVANLIGGGK